MANDTSALARPPPDGAPSQHDYQAFWAALSDSARGRAFLAEYARRNRHADTQMLLAALDRLEAQVARHAAAPEADRIRQELRALLGAMLTARPAIDDSAGAVKAAKLMTLLELVQHRIEAIVVPAQEQAALPDAVAALVNPKRPAAEVARSVLAVVEPPDEPELPIPSPAGAQQPPIALVGQDHAQTKHDPEKACPGLDPGWEPVFGQDHAQSNSLRTATIMPEVTFVGGAPPKPAAIEPAVVEPAIVEIAVEMTIAPLASAIVEGTVAAPAAQTAPPVPAAVENEVPPQAAAALPPADPLALIMALSEHERIALFT